MQKTNTGKLIYSPSDLICYLKSPFASWMERYNIEFRSIVEPDKETDDERLIAETGNKHEEDVLKDFRAAHQRIAEIPKEPTDIARTRTREALDAKAPVIYQAFLEDGSFAGFADFLELGDGGRYEVLDTKLARAPKPYYAIQLCCYSEMLAATLKEPLPDKFGIILGGKDRVEFRVEDFIHYYRRIKAGFLAMQGAFTGDFAERPDPLPRAEHGRWTSCAEQFFAETDHLVQVAGISVGQIKKLKSAGIATVSALAAASGQSVPKLSQDTLDKLAAQARLQRETCVARLEAPEGAASYEVLPSVGPNGEAVGLAALPPPHSADVFFDMEGFPLAAGGLEYLFGACTRTIIDGRLEFKDWWAHDREEERLALEGFVDWAFKRWISNPGMHIYHYAAYDVSAVRRLSTRHDTRQDEVDQLLRNSVFVDLYKIVRRGLRVGEPSYSLKAIEGLYRAKRTTEVGTSIGSMVHYAHWIQSGEPRDWQSSEMLKAIRDYNEDDCVSTVELEAWLRGVAGDMPALIPAIQSAVEFTPEPPSPEAIARAELAAKLRERGDDVAIVLADVVDYHRREEKPMWWQMFDRAVSEPEILRYDANCIEGVEALGSPVPEARSMVQTYRFDPDQQCKLAATDKSKVMFAHNLDAKLNLVALDASKGELRLKVGTATLNKAFGGAFPECGSLIPDEYVPAGTIQTALSEVAAGHLSGALHGSVAALLNRVPPSSMLQKSEESTVEAAIRVTRSMEGGCLVIQGPPGSGKTYTASHVIKALLEDGRRIGVASNGHKAIVNLLAACGEAIRMGGGSLQGVKVGGDAADPVFSDNPLLKHIESGAGADAAYEGGVIAGTAWLFSRPEWEGELDFLFVDEAGQVPLANVIAMARCAANVVLLGDQMQLEQPVQGSHPGDAGLSALQYALKDLDASKPDAPIFHAVVPAECGLFLGESRRMHPNVCTFISESIYEGRLDSHADCARQRIEFNASGAVHIAKKSGIVFVAVEHDGNVQQSDEEVVKVMEVFQELSGRPYVASDGTIRPLHLENFLFISPYNAQVRALKKALPDDARVGSVDKFQGMEAPVCILSLCSSYGEYGSRGLGFILDRNRINVAISRAQCLAIVVADPRIADTPAGSIAEMRLLNLFCKLKGADDRCASAVVGLPHAMPKVGSTSGT